MSNKMMRGRKGRRASGPIDGRGGTGRAVFPIPAGRLLAETETALADESSGPGGHLIPVPNTPDEGEDDDTEGDDALAGLRADVANLRGRVALVETTSAGWGEGHDAGPGVGNSDWRPQRIGAHPPKALVSLRSDAATAVLSACGVPVELVAGGAELR
ncbi:MAG: hypothetical protein OXH15_16870 [Gammaproteobacteria bacterium]|nr:hypothetical protein [Gammaproteobacteria bacterium]